MARVETDAGDTVGTWASSSTMGRLEALKDIDDELTKL
jgi:hypothetical protein